MKFIIASDIFGHTKALENLARLCFKGRFEFEIFSPYIEGISFEDESEAYEYFITNVGLDKYTEDLRRFLMSFSQAYLVSQLCLLALAWERLRYGG